MSNAPAHKPSEIIARFARQLGHIIADYLTNPDLGDKRHPLKDRIAAKLMLTLSEKAAYRKDLLFHAYRSTDERWIPYDLPGGKRQKLHTESIYYVQAVLGKRLTVVSKHKSLPTNLHILLLMQCRYSLDRNWLKTRIKRLKVQTAHNDKDEKVYFSDIPEPNDFFCQITNVLKNQWQRLKNVSAVSNTYQGKYGILCLIANQNRTELPEEMSLFDVVEAAPAPLNPAIKQPPVWYMPLLERILLSLNENYGLSRSCGLPPQQFG